MSARPPEHLIHGHNGPVVILSGRVCAYLNRFADLERFRLDHRGQDAEVDAALVAMRVAAAAWRGSATGTARAATAEPPASSKSWCSTKRAADLLHIGERAVRKAIAADSLPARKVDGRWVIAREDIEHYRARRTAA